MCSSENNNFPPLRSTRINWEFFIQVYKVLKEQYRMNWLPDKQLEWYHRELWCLDKSKKAERALPRLHDALQRFAITFHHLRIFRLKSNINADVTMIRRNNIIDGMRSETLRVNRTSDQFRYTRTHHLSPANLTDVIFYFMLCSRCCAR